MAAKWTSTAGPIQTKRVGEALSSLGNLASCTYEQCGTRGVNEYRMRVQTFGMGLGGTKIGPQDDDRPTAGEAIRAICVELGERFAWSITRDNHAEILAAAKEATTRAEALVPVVDRRTDPLTEEQVREAAEATARGRAEYDAKEAEERAARRRITDKVPPGAAAVITAEWHEDDSHLQSDYSASPTRATFAVGWRFGRREDFAQLRSAAERFLTDPTPRLAQCSGAKHYGAGTCNHDETTPHAYTLTTGAEVVAALTEHRDNHSMGAGNYLSDHGWQGGGTGWTFQSAALTDRYGLPAGTIDALPAVTVARVPRERSASDVALGMDATTTFHTDADLTTAPAVVSASTMRAGFVEIRFAAKPDEDVRAELKRSGFRWALRSACWYGPAERLPARYAA